MRFGDNESGIFGIMFGMVLLVMFAVTIGVLKDKRLGLSSHRADNLTEIENDAIHLASLSQEVEQLKTKEESRRKTGLATENEWHACERNLVELENTLREKRRLVPQLHATAILSEQEFAAYRHMQRQSVRTAALGEKIDKLTTNSGRTYENAIIKAITDEGIEISHQHGLSRIDFRSLSADWLARFRWHEK